MSHPRQDRAGSRLKLAALAVAVASIACGVAGCGSSSHDASRNPTTTASTPTATTATRSSGIVQGRVLAGPTCPVERAGQPCPPRPVVGTVGLLDADGLARATATIAPTGDYRTAVAPGTYTVTVAGGAHCATRTVTVTKGAVVRADITCDTGIR